MGYGLDTRNGRCVPCIIEREGREKKSGRPYYNIRYYDSAGVYRGGISLWKEDVRPVPYRPAPIR